MGTSLPLLLLLLPRGAFGSPIIHKLDKSREKASNHNKSQEIDERPVDLGHRVEELELPGLKLALRWASKVISGSSIHAEKTQIRRWFDLVIEGLEAEGQEVKRAPACFSLVTGPGYGVRCELRRVSCGSRLVNVVGACVGAYH